MSHFLEHKAFPSQTTYLVVDICEGDASSPQLLLQRRHDGYAEVVLVCNGADVSFDSSLQARPLQSAQAHGSGWIIQDSTRVFRLFLPPDVIDFTFDGKKHSINDWGELPSDCTWDDLHVARFRSTHASFIRVTTAEIPPLEDFPPFRMFDEHGEPLLMTYCNGAAGTLDAVAWSPAKVDSFLLERTS